MENVEMQIGQMIKARDFGHIDSDYIIGEITYVSSTGYIEGIIEQRFMNNVDVTGQYDDGYFTTVQNGRTMMDRESHPRLTALYDLGV
jgi:hypothetical protein|tara:strand:- start:713 stop:976 length:264 start_codon:yes stop_codon:yes gene_type:complete